MRVWEGLEGFGRVWEGLGGWGRGGNRVFPASKSFFWLHQGLRVTAATIFLVFFLGFSIDRSKKYIKTIKMYIKVDAVDP